MRDEIKKFAEVMEQEMAWHDIDKGDSWKDMTEGGLDELLEDAFADYERHPSRGQMIDIANICMMLWHKKRGAER